MFNVCAVFTGQYLGGNDPQHMVGCSNTRFFRCDWPCVDHCLATKYFLVMLILFPFYVPVLIFASTTVILAAQSLSVKDPVAWLGLLLILSISFSP